MSAGAFPRRFGSYVLLKPLARGGMGELDLAVTGGRGVEKLCVIKKVLPHLLDGESVQRFKDEVMVVVRLSHGNLVGVLDAGREQGELYLTLDFVEGKDLLATWNRCATKRIAFPVEIAVYIVKELVRGLAYAHAFRDLKLVHRDVSPANVLLSYTGEVKLTDFGLATSKLKEQHTAPGIIYGKLAYLAPEQARGQPLDGRTDLYSAGILLWEMLTGQPLFPLRPATEGAPRGQDSTIDALDRVRHPRVEPPSKLTSRVPPELDEIVMRALAPEPAQRYQSGEAMRADLASFLAESAPETDAATLADFMTVLFEEQISLEREERDQLMARAFDPGPADRAGGGGAIGRGTPPPPRHLELVASPVPDATPAPSARAPASWVGPQTGSPRQAFGSTPPRSSVDREDDASPPREPTPAGPAALASSPRPTPTPPRPPPLIGEESVRDGAATPRPPPDPDVARTSADDLRAPPWWSQGQEPDPRVGTTIGGRYYLRRLCGEGAMGRVYEGHHIEIGRRVAVKILHAGYSHTPDVVERFRREARAASRIGHPNIVDVTDSGLTSDGSLFFVMDYFEGVNLEQLIAREGPLPRERALLIAAQVCRALSAAHAAGIVHRDLKPANVMLGAQRDGEDLVKVLDFGISKQKDLEGKGRKEASLTRPDAAVGTPIYMAPEQISGLPTDARTDVYAVGELLYEMLTGVPPYQGSDIVVVFNKKANHEPALIRTVRSDLPESVERLIGRAMSRRPEDRHPTMTALKNDVIACLASPDTALAAAIVASSGAPGDTSLAPSALPVHAGRATPGLFPVATPPRGRLSSRAFWITIIGAVVGVGCAAAFLLDRPPLESPAPRLTRSPAALAPSDEGAATAAESAPRPASMLPRPPVEDPHPVTPTAPRSTLQSSELPAATAAASGGGGPSPASTPSAAAGIADEPGTFSGGPNAVDGNKPGRPRRRARGGGGGVANREPAAPFAAPTAFVSDRLAAGRAAFAEGDFPGAVRAARSALAASPTTEAGIEARQLLGDAYFRLDRFADAVREYGAALSMDPANAQVRRARDLATQRLAGVGTNGTAQSIP